MHYRHTIITITNILVFIVYVPSVSILLTLNDLRDDFRNCLIWIISFAKTLILYHIYYATSVVCCGYRVYTDSMITVVLRRVMVYTVPNLS